MPDLPRIIRNSAHLFHQAAQKNEVGTALPLSSEIDTVAIQIDGGLAAATGTLTLAANAANDETVTIGLRTYTFKTALTSPEAADEVLIGATASDSIDNLIAAINHDAGAGTLYGSDTQTHNDVTAAAGVGDTMDVTHRLTGTIGNSVSTTETLAAVGSQWGGANLAGGTDFTGTISFFATMTDQPGTPFAIAGTPVGGGAAVTSATAIGLWQFNAKGLGAIITVLSGYGGGTINVRGGFSRQSQG